jgi:transcriptional regulator with XRE-family HTH domain
MVKVKRKRIVYSKPFLKVKGAMVENGVTQEEMAEHLNISQSTFNQKINGISDFKLTEIKAIADKLGIQADRFQEYFFPL